MAGYKKYDYDKIFDAMKGRGEITMKEFLKIINSTIPAGEIQVKSTSVNQILTGMTYLYPIYEDNTKIAIMESNNG